MDWDTTKAPGRFTELPSEIASLCMERCRFVSGEEPKDKQAWYEGFLENDEAMTLTTLVELLEDDLSGEGYSVNPETLRVCCHLCSKPLGVDDGVDDGYGERVHTGCQSVYEEA